MEMVRPVLAAISDPALRAGIALEVKGAADYRTVQEALTIRGFGGVGIHGGCP